MKPFILISLVISLQSAIATDVWYGDVKGESPDGRFVVRAASPENRKKNPGPFQSNFSYTLLDRRSGRVQWRYGPGENVEPPGSIFVSNTGRVLIISAYDSLIYFRPSGQRIELPGIFTLLPKREVTRFCDDTTAGMFWDQFSWRDFMMIGDAEYFCIRTYWGRFIIVDLEREEITRDRKVRLEIEKHILREARRVFTLPSTKYRTYCASCGRMETNPVIQQGIFVLLLHREKGIDKFLRLIFAADDHIWPDPKAYLPRLKPALARTYPPRQDPASHAY